MKSKVLFGGLLSLLMATGVFAQATNAPGFRALKNTVILVIRHAEKPDSGFTLSAEGELRAKAYADYFKTYTVEGQSLKLDCLFAAADSKGSHRPRLTIEPTAKALGLPFDQHFANKDFQGLADEIRAKPHGQAILIAWHHGEIPELLRALGADPAQVIPGDKWPEEVFGWVIQLRYDADGRLLEAKRIEENLMPDDSDKKSTPKSK